MPTQQYSDRMASSGRLSAVEIAALQPPASPDAIAKGVAMRLAAMPKLSGAAFIRRFTATEYGAIRLAAQTKLAAGNPQLSLWIDTILADGEVNLHGTAASSAKAALLAAMLLTQARADIIFSP